MPAESRFGLIRHAVGVCQWIEWLKSLYQWAWTALRPIILTRDSEGS